MSATTRRRKSAAPYRIVQVGQHWTIVRGTFYRDCVVEYVDGRRALLGVRDDLVSVAA